MRVVLLYNIDRWSITCSNETSGEWPTRLLRCDTRELLGLPFCGNDSNCFCLRKLPSKGPVDSMSHAHAHNIMYLLIDTFKVQLKFITTGN